MKITIPIEQVKKGDRIGGKPVVEVLHRNHAKYVRLILQGGWPIADGHCPYCGSSRRTWVAGEGIAHFGCRECGGVYKMEVSEDESIA